MKKIIILPLLFCAFAVSAQNFAPVGAKWCYISSEGTSPGNEYPYYYHVVKDTSINDSVYALIKWKYIFYTLSEAGTVFLYREEQNKIYIRINNKNYLLYDFGLMPGDSIKYTISEEYVPVDFPIYNNFPNQVKEYGYKMTEDSTAEIISKWGMNGVISKKYGSKQALLGRSSTFLLGEGYEMNIVGYRDSTYEYGSLDACNILLSEKQKIVSKISPVSVKTAPGNVVNISVPEGFGAYEAAVVDMQGREVVAPKTFTGNASIKLSGLAPAMYVVRISGAAGFSQGFLVPVE